MNDIKLIRNDFSSFADKVKRKDKNIDINGLFSLDIELREIIEKVEILKAEKNNLSKEIGMRKRNGEAAEDLVSKVDNINVEIKSLDSDLDNKKETMKRILERIPNLPDASVPKGEDENDNLLIRTWGEPNKEKKFCLTGKLELS